MKDLKQRKKYNKEINILPRSLQNKTMIGSSILVRLYQFDQLGETKHGVKDPKYVSKYSDKGQPGAKIDNILYKPEGIIVQIPEGAKDYISSTLKAELKPGQKVQISHKAISFDNQVFPDRSSAKVPFEGFIKVHPMHLEFVVDEEPLPLEFKTSKFKSLTQAKNDNPE